MDYKNKIKEMIEDIENEVYLNYLYTMCKQFKKDSLTDTKGAEK